MLPILVACAATRERRKKGKRRRLGDKKGDTNKQERGGRGEDIIGEGERKEGRRGKREERERRGRGEL